MVISQSIYLESFYEVDGYYINPSVLFIQQKMIKIPDLQSGESNICRAVKRPAELPPRLQPLNTLKARWRAAGSARVRGSTWVRWETFGKLKDKGKHLNVVLLVKMLAGRFGKHGNVSVVKMCSEKHVPKGREWATKYLRFSRLNYSWRNRLTSQLWPITGILILAII